MPNTRDITLRAQTVALRSFGAPAKEVERVTGIGERTQRRWMQLAEERGYVIGGPLLDKYLSDEPPKRVPHKRTPSFDAAVAEKWKDGSGKPKSTKRIAEEFKAEGRDVSHQLVWRSLRLQGLIESKTAKTKTTQETESAEISKTPETPKQATNDEPTSSESNESNKYLSILYIPSRLRNYSSINSTT